MRVPDLFVATLSAALTAGIIAVGVTDLHRATDAANDWIAAGATVLEITAQPDEKGVEDLDPFACGTIARSASVVSAGASRGANPDLRVEWEPSNMEIRIWDVTVDALAVWWPEAPLTEGLFVGADLAARTGITAGSVVHANSETATVTEVLPTTVLPDAWRSSLVRTVPIVEEGSWSCWIRVEPAALDAASQIAGSAYPTQPIVVTPYFKADELRRMPASILEEGPGRWVCWAAILLTLVLEILLGLVGRGEAGIYRATGSRHRDLWAMATVRAVVVISLPVALATASAVAAALLFTTSVPDFASLWYVIQPVALYAFAAVAMSPAVIACCAIGTVAGALDHKP
ncbi:MAG: hypothetical protein LBS27_09600 [Bifidobacteriaceae bacterium]|nr:hypothetical protein [Bifidobacteriaceae bacterium]